MNLLEGCKHESGEDLAASSCTLGSKVKEDGQGWQVVTRKKNRVCTLQKVSEEVKIPEKMLTQVEIGGKQWENIVFVA